MINVAIVGVSGFTGLELVKQLIRHPSFHISYVANSEGNTTLQELHPMFEGIVDMPVRKASATDIAKCADVAILALPHKSSMEFAKELLDLGIKVVDLSADYRLELEHYEANYCKHIDKINIGKAGYAIPELFRESLKDKNLISSPGCYPTATLLAIAPFLPYIKEGSNIFIDAKSGVSGAGKKCSTTTHYVTINENIFAYNPIKHRHAIEIYEKIEKLSSKKMNIHFIPHLLPLTRGMLVSVYTELTDEIEPILVLKEFYKNEEFIRVRERPPGVKDVARTHFCDLFALRNGNALFVSSAIDNLLRGAVTQAIAGLNIMFGLKESTGLPKLADMP